jgi:hypothetical protein
MATRRCRSILMRFAAVGLALLLGAAWAGAQEQQKEPPKKVEPAKKAESKGKAQERQPKGQPEGKTGKQAPAQQAPADIHRGQPATPGGHQATPARPAQQVPAYRAQQAPAARGEATGVWPARTSRPASVSTTRGGEAVHRDQSGRVTSVRAPSGAVVYHAPEGIRRVEMVRPGNHVVVAVGPHQGYVQRPLVYRDRQFVKRTYYVGGRPYARVYRPMVYRGVWFQVYTPVRFYRPAYYAYVVNPWPTPVFWNWGWGGSPWFAFYGGYFAPYSYYRSPALWLTDYFIAATLQAAYEARVAASMAPAPVVSDEVVLSPEVKQLVADEVQRQIERERAESRSAVDYYGADDSPAWADNGSHVFVAYTPLGVNSNMGPCTIGEGDVLQMTGMPPAYAASANVVVLASRRRNCVRGSTVSVSLQDLQDMSNRMRETVETGLGDLQARQGQAGIPPMPADAAGVVYTPLAAEATPDPEAEAEVSQVYNDADQADRSALGQAAGGTGETPTVSLGQTMDQVRAVLGPPLQIMNAGTRQIYLYRNLKVTFVDGRVSDIQ